MRIAFSVNLGQIVLNQLLKWILVDSAGKAWQRVVRCGVVGSDKFWLGVAGGFGRVLIWSVGAWVVS